MTTAVEVAEKGHQLAAWVNFDGTLAMTVGSSYGPDAPPADFSSPNPIRAAYNVDYIIDRGTGQYEIHFENAMPDANYVISGMVSNTQDDWQSVSTYANRGPTGIFQNGTTQPSSESCRVQTRYGSNSTSDGNDLDFSQVTVAFFR